MSKLGQNSTAIKKQTGCRQVATIFYLDQGFGREKDGNRGKFIGSNLVIFCYKEFEIFALCKSFSQSEATFIVYAEPIESGNVKINFS